MSSAAEDIKFLKDLQKQMQWESEHDYDSQASPRFWTVKDYRKVPAAEGYDDSEMEYFHNDGDHTAFESFEELKEFLETYYEDEIEDSEHLQEVVSAGDFDDLWEYTSENLNDDGFFNAIYVKEEGFLVPDTMFLTKEEAKSHLERNHYHYTSKAHTYAMTSWRAPKVERLIKILNEFDFDSIQVK